MTKRSAHRQDGEVTVAQPTAPVPPKANKRRGRNRRKPNKGAKPNDGVKIKDSAEINDSMEINDSVEINDSAETKHQNNTWLPLEVLELILDNV